MSSPDEGDSDFQTPHIDEEENDQLEWDSHEESLTFVHHSTPDNTDRPDLVPGPPWVFDPDSDEIFSVWPPRNLSSEFSQIYFEEVAVPKLVPLLEESLEDTVFEAEEVFTLDKS